jgi:hypothetical protein
MASRPVSDEAWAHTLREGWPHTSSTATSTSTELVGLVPCLRGGQAGEPDGLVGPIASECPIWSGGCSARPGSSFPHERNGGRMRLGKKLGGRKTPWDSATRREVMRRARSVGAERAGAAFGVPAGTVRSWLRRAAVKAADDDDAEARLAAVRAEGAAMVARRELQMASPEGKQLSEAGERVRLATIRWLGTSDGGPGRVEAEIELTEAKIQAAELREELERREW